MYQFLNLIDPRLRLEEEEEGRVRNVFQRFITKNMFDQFLYCSFHSNNE